VAKRPADGRMTVVEHLAELRLRLIISISAVALGAVVSFVFADDIITWFLRFYEDATDGARDAFIFTGPVDAFATRLKVATYGGIVLATPVWLWELWRFVTPGLHPREKRYAIPFVITAVALFLLGGVVALFTLEPALDFLLGVGGDSLQPLLTADKFISLVSLMIVAFGIAFEFPVVLTFLLVARVITTQQLRQARRWAVVGIFAFAALITPSQDPYSLFLLAVPLVLFYEVVILIGRVMKR
jgi:sec-independent protein translocase protein TatC